MKSIILFLLLSVVSATSETPICWVEIARKGENHMQLTLHNPTQAHFALQVSFDMKDWGYLGSTTNAVTVFSHCYVGLFTNAAFYRARSWSGPIIPPTPPCN